MRANKVDFFVVGVQKCGTTTLHEWLKKSAEIVLPREKETRFFLDEEIFSRGDEWYFSQFTKVRSTTKIIGEIDPDYIYCAESYARIAQFAKAPKFIIVLRDPISRAKSHYQMSVLRGYEPLAFSDALIAESSRLAKGDQFSIDHHSYLDRGLYAKQIERIQGAFPSSRFLILLFDDLFSSQDGANDSMQKICEFLGVDNSLNTIDVEKKENQAAEPRSIMFRDFMYGNGRVKAILSGVIPTSDLRRRVKVSLNRWNARAIPDHEERRYENIKQNVPSFVYEALIDDLLKLEKLVDLDFSRWIGEYRAQLQERGAWQ